MALYKFLKQEQRLKSIWDSLPERENLPGKKKYLIDSTFNHFETNNCGKVEKSIFNETISSLITKERKQIEEEENDRDF